MTDEEACKLKTLLKDKVKIAWSPDDNTFRPVNYIGPPPPVMEEFDVEEPSECAYFSGGMRGQYVALYNCEISEFIEYSRLK